MVIACNVSSLMIVLSFSSLLLCLPSLITPLSTLVCFKGVFRPFEKLADVRMFVADALVNPHSIFSLASVGKVLEDDSANLIQLDMVRFMSF